MNDKYLGESGFSHFWQRLKVLLNSLSNRVDALEQGGGGGGGGNDVGLYIDEAGYICQRIGSDD